MTKLSLNLAVIAAILFAGSAYASECQLAACTYTQHGTTYYSSEAAVNIDGGQATDCTDIDSAAQDAVKTASEKVCTITPANCTLGFADGGYNLSIDDTVVSTFSDSTDIAKNVAAGKAELAKLVKQKVCAAN